jgi:hypothetical protein
MSSVRSDRGRACEEAVVQAPAPELFAGHDQGAENWACIAYITDVLTKLVNLWPASRLDELTPWAWLAQRTAEKLAA